MKYMILSIALVLSFFLYINGYMVMRSKLAVTFTGDGKGQKNRMGFSVTKCNGWASKVLKVKENGIYRFDLDAELSAGTLQFQVLDREKQTLLTLNPDAVRGRVQLEKGKRYLVKMQFIQTSGTCAANWVKE